LKGLNVSEINDFSLDNYNNKVSEQKKLKCQNAGIVVMPYKHGDGEYYFAQETVNFIKFTNQQSNEVDLEILSDPNDIKVRALHSFDIWMPIIYIASSILLPVAINVVSDYISDLIRGRETDENRVKMTLIVKDGDKTKELNYDGDIRTFKEAFEKIDITKL
jgi:hypothetical protein